MSDVPAEVVAALVPTGKLRASINLGNPILAKRDSVTAAPGGVSVDLARRQASIARSPTSPAVVDTFVEQHADVAAGVKQQLEADAQRLGGLRLLDGRFMVIRQAMGAPKRRGPAAAAYLARFVEEMKAGGFVAEALERHGIQGASVAPAEAASP